MIKVHYSSLHLTAPLGYTQRQRERPAEPGERSNGAWPRPFDRCSESAETLSSAAQPPVAKSQVEKQKKKQQQAAHVDAKRCFGAAGHCRSHARGPNLASALAPLRQPRIATAMHSASREDSQPAGAMGRHETRPEPA